MGAGGPPRRAAGRASSTPAGSTGLAAVIEADPLLRLHAEAAAKQLGFAPTDAAAEGRGARVAFAAVFVGLDSADACPRCGPAASRRPAASAPLLVGYAARGRELAAVHELHACCDVVLELRAVAGRARFAYLSAGSAVEQARLTPREADVLVLVLAGLSTAALAARLCVSPATARTHCRALLRKLGAGDRRALRARLLGAAPAASVGPQRIAVPDAVPSFAQPTARSLRRNRP
jgi:DNA-binding CsgD family transcriptional regulator